MVQNKSLRSRCGINTNIEDDRFVGINHIDDEITVSFPLGYNLDNLSDEELRKEIKTLINTLKNNVEHEESKLINESRKNTDTSLPIHAYVSIIQDYLSRGYYKETEIIYSTGNTGKVNWSRTIINQKAVLQDDEAFYLNYTVRKNRNNYNELISLIHKYCVYVSFKVIGWLYSSYLPDKLVIRYDYKLFKSVILDKLQSTFNDRNKELFMNMLAIIDYQGDKNAPEKYTYGTNRFEYVWENMIDRIFGIENKQEYFPSTEWHLKGKDVFESSKLEPDTIMMYEGDIYILDAKYYKYGVTVNPKDLPSSSSINKQITYGEYVDKLKVDNGYNYEIYNAFIMPFDSKSEEWRNKKADYIENIGEAVSKWKSGNDKYERIQGILVDTKYLTRIVTSQNIDEIRKLAEAIKKAF